MGPVAVQAVCQKMYDHHYYLSKEEAIQNHTSLSQYREQKQEQNKNMPCTRKMCWSNQKNKPPSSKEDYIPYQNVSPSAKTLNEYKLLLVVQEETETANALFNIPESVKQNYTMTLYLVIGQVSYSVFLITGDLFCALYFLHLKRKISYVVCNKMHSFTCES